MFGSNDDAELVCSRCGRKVSDGTDGKDVDCYDMAQDQWKDYAKKGDKYVCDQCMHGSKMFQAVFGRLT